MKGWISALGGLALLVHLGVRPAPQWDTCRRMRGAERTGAPALRLAFTRGSGIYLYAEGTPRPRPLRDRAGAKGGFANDGFMTPYYFWEPKGRRLLVVSGFDSGPDTDELVTPSGRYIRDLSRSGGPQMHYGPYWAVDRNGLDFESERVAASGPSKGSPVISALSETGRARTIWPKGARSAPASHPCDLGAPLQGYDPAQRPFALENAYLAKYVQWDPRRGLIVFAGCGGWWKVARTATGRSGALPFRTDSPISLGGSGCVVGAAARGRARIVCPWEGGAARVLGTGYDPVWSPDGQWVYFIGRTSIRRLTFRIQWEPVPNSPPSLVQWRVVHSAIYRVSVFRAHPDGGGRQLVTSQLAYGFASLNVLADGSVVFTRVPSDLRLWRHRHQGLTLERVNRYKPIMDIEIAQVGRPPHVLIRNAHLPAVQPTDGS